MIYQWKNVGEAFIYFLGHYGSQKASITTLSPGP